MKNKYFFISLLILAFLSGFTSCEKVNEEGTSLEHTTKNLSGTWKIESVRLDDYPVDVDGLEIILTFTKEGSYSASNADVMPGEDPDFPSGSKWGFPDDSTFSKILINKGEVDFNSVSISEEELTFSYKSHVLRDLSPSVEETIYVSASKQY